MPLHRDKVLAVAPPGLRLTSSKRWKARCTDAIRVGSPLPRVITSPRPSIDSRDADPGAPATRARTTSAGPVRPVITIEMTSYLTPAPRVSEPRALAHRPGEEAESERAIRTAERASRPDRAPPDQSISRSTRPSHSCTARPTDSGSAFSE
ncbi:hypothetical protein GCM10023222_50480 [Saccharopolyspora cebuensis]